MEANLWRSKKCSLFDDQRQDFRQDGSVDMWGQSRTDRNRMENGDREREVECKREKDMISGVTYHSHEGRSRDGR